MTVMAKPEQTNARTMVSAPALSPTTIAKPDLISVEQAKSMDVARMTDLFKAHLNPGQLHFMKLLGFHKVKIERADGMYYYDQDGRANLDFFGGFGSLAFGHNHPRVVEARKKFQDEKRQEIAIAFMSQYASALAHNLAACSPGDLDMVFLGSSGSEAMEAAIKVAERAAGPKKPKIAYAENSFHGKTKGVLSITDGQLYRGDFWRRHIGGRNGDEAQRAVNNLGDRGDRREGNEAIDDEPAPPGQFRTFDQNCQEDWPEEDEFLTARVLGFE